jgi:hypothetical protein
VIRSLVIDGYRVHQARSAEEGEPAPWSLPVSDRVDESLTRQVGVETLRELPPMHGRCSCTFTTGPQRQGTAQLLGLPTGTSGGGVCAG